MINGKIQYYGIILNYWRVCPKRYYYGLKILLLTMAITNIILWFQKIVWKKHNTSRKIFAFTANVSINFSEYSQKTEVTVGFWSWSQCRETGCCSEHSETNLGLFDVIISSHRKTRSPIGFH